jgi:hypothetical protein
MPMSKYPQDKPPPISLWLLWVSDDLLWLLWVSDDLLWLLFDMLVVECELDMDCHGRQMCAAAL